MRARSAPPLRRGMAPGASSSGFSGRAGTSGMAWLNVKVRCPARHLRTTSRVAMTFAVGSAVSMIVRIASAKDASFAHAFAVCRAISRTQSLILRMSRR